MDLEGGGFLSIGVEDSKYFLLARRAFSGENTGGRYPNFTSFPCCNILEGVLLAEDCPCLRCGLFGMSSSKSTLGMWSSLLFRSKLSSFLTLGMLGGGLRGGNSFYKAKLMPCLSILLVLPLNFCRKSWFFVFLSDSSMQIKLMINYSWWMSLTDEEWNGVSVNHRCSCGQ